MGGENMATRKCGCGCTTKKSTNKTSRTSSTHNKTEASTDNAKTRTTATKRSSSRVKNCN